MTRNLVGALLIGGCVLTVIGCDTSPGSGSNGPSVTATHNYTESDKTKYVPKKSMGPTGGNAPAGGGSEPGK